MRYCTQLCCLQGSYAAYREEGHALEEKFALQDSGLDCDPWEKFNLEYVAPSTAKLNQPSTVQYMYTVLYRGKQKDPTSQYFQNISFNKFRKKSIMVKHVVGKLNPDDPRDSEKVLFNNYSYSFVKKRSKFSLNLPTNDDDKIGTIRNTLFFIP